MSDPETTQIVEYIQTTEKRGRGDTEENAIRNVRQLWTKDGILIAEYDPHTAHSWFRPDKEI